MRCGCYRLVDSYLTMRRTSSIYPHSTTVFFSKDLKKDSSSDTQSNRLANNFCAPPSLLQQQRWRQGREQEEEHPGTKQRNQESEPTKSEPTKKTPEHRPSRLWFRPRQRKRRPYNRDDQGKKKNQRLAREGFAGYARAGIK